MNWEETMGLTLALFARVDNLNTKVEQGHNAHARQ
jgi:hypothetical protein